MLTIMLAKFLLNDVPHILGMSASGFSFPPGYIFLGERKLGPFQTSEEADSALNELDYTDEEVYAGFLNRHGPAYLMLALPPAKQYVMYHVTSVSNIESILAHGLLVSSEPRLTARHKLESHGIYLGDDITSIAGFFCEPDPGEQVELLEILISWDRVLWVDPEIVEMGSFLSSEIGFFISKVSIPPNQIRVASKSVKAEVKSYWEQITKEYEPLLTYYKSYCVEETPTSYAVYASYDEWKELRSPLHLVTKPASLEDVKNWIDQHAT